MGGGSSDAAAALRGLCRLHGLAVDLAPIAAELGSDVPFFLNGGRARAAGHGEQLEVVPGEPGWFAVACPEIEVSTEEVYKRWDAIGGRPPNELQAAALDLHPELATFGERLGEGWQLTGSGSAWFKPFGARPEAEAAARSAPGWTAVSWAVPRWA